jgi:hypothetical protein
MKIPFYRSMQETPPYGSLHGLTLGLIFMIILYYLSQIYLYLPWYLICGYREPKIGITNSSPPHFHLK